MQVARHVHVTFEHVPGPHSSDIAVCRVDVAAADEPIYLRPHTGDRTPRFPVRVGNSTRILDVDDTVAYVTNHWPHRRRTWSIITPPKPATRSTKNPTTRIPHPSTSQKD